MKIKVSIIIPVYNTEKLLRRCLDSCINQTLDEIEIIVVNDASPDHSDKIMEDYEKRFPNKIKCIYLKENIRQGGARNIAIQCAVGEFVTFVDSDDWIQNKMCEELYYEAKRTLADIVYCNLLSQIRDGRYLKTNRFSNESVGNVSDNITGILMEPAVGPAAHIIKRNIIVDNMLYFPERIVAEDTAITKLWDLYADKIMKIEGAYYVYCRNMDSTGRSELKKYRSDEYECVKQLYDNLMNCVKVEKNINEVRLICIHYALEFAIIMIQKSGRRFENSIERDFKNCINYICGDICEQSEWKYWFTPKEKEIILGKIDFDFYSKQDSNRNIEDYRCYYQKLYESIREIIEYYEKQGIVRIGIWGNTEYAIGFNKVFSAMSIVDNIIEIEQNQIQCVMCLRVAHIPNIREQLKGKSIHIFNLQTYLWTRQEIKKYCYFTGM